MSDRGSYHAIAATVASLVAAKQAAYGDMFAKSVPVLELLYPNGIPPNGVRDALLVARVVDKLARISTDPDALGESPWQDILGYALLALEARERARQPPVEAT